MFRSHRTKIVCWDIICYCEKLVLCKDQNLYQYDHNNNNTCDLQISSNDIEKNYHTKKRLDEFAKK